MKASSGILVACALVAAAPLHAQENRAWPERVFATIDVAFQPLNNNFSESLAFPDTVRRTENVRFETDYASTRGPSVDVGAGVRIAKRLGAGVVVSWFQRSGAGSLDLRVPSPIAADSPLALTGSVPALNRRELGVHVQALHALPLGTRARLMLAGGPSVFRLTQDLVRSVQFDVLPGFTALKFDQARVATVERTAIGFNVGATVTWPLASHVAVDGLTRYARAKTTLDPGAQSNLSRAIEVRAGGLQIGGGIHLLF